MTHRALIRVMLSLLLLMSQQMALTHVMSHWTATLHGNSQAVHDQGGDDGGLSKSAAQDQTCHQCLAFAQLASFLGNTPRYFAPADAASLAIASAAAQPGCVRTECGFQPRAPPVLV